MGVQSEIITCRAGSEMGVPLGRYAYQTGFWDNPAYKNIYLASRWGLPIIADVEASYATGRTLKADDLFTMDMEAKKYAEAFLVGSISWTRGADTLSVSEPITSPGPSPPFNATYCFNKKQPEFAPMLLDQATWDAQLPDATDTWLLRHGLWQIDWSIWINASLFSSGFRYSLSLQALPFYPSYTLWQTADQVVTYGYGTGTANYTSYLTLPVHGRWRISMLLTGDFFLLQTLSAGDTAWTASATCTRLGTAM
jgi:hypothetical protein